MTLKFHERFEVAIATDDAQTRFVNRAHNHIFYHLYNEASTYYLDIMREIAYELGIEYRADIIDPRAVVRNGFYDCLQAIEAFYRVVPPEFQAKLQLQVIKILKDSEIDLGIRWENGRFLKSGAKLLDEKLVNEPLRWLADQRYEGVLTPYSKGIEHFLHSEKRPELLSDVITDMYEALEALSKIVTGRDSKDLSANAEVFLKEVAASEPYKRILKEYISYANKFRHAVTNNRPILTASEAESFIYLTGIFIRLAM